MDRITITCPHCGQTREVDTERIPANVREVFCRACQKVFPFGGMAQSEPSPSFPAPQASPRRIPFVFTGSAGEYFGIWIVNTLLKIVTLGLYSPWAKVRKRRYFYGNTLLAEANFDYLANPLALLKGWLIGAALFLCYTLGSQYSPLVGMGFGVLFFLLLPWVIVRSRLFNNRNSAHRNVRFNFRPAYREAYAAFAWLPILTPFTAGLLTPYVYYRQKRFLMANNAFGTSPFAFEVGARDFYLLALKIFGLAVLLIGGAGGAAALLLPQLSQTPAALPALSGIGLPLLIFAAYFLVGVYAYVRTANLSWNGTRIGENRFVSTLRVRDMTWILFSNLAAAVLSAGLLIPWASVRLARYRLGHLFLDAQGDLDAFRAERLAEVGAAGEEIGDVFGIDIGI